MHKGGPYNFWGDNPGMLSLLQAEGEVGQPFLANICHKIMNQFPSTWRRSPDSRLVTKVDCPKEKTELFV